MGPQLSQEKKMAKKKYPVKGETFTKDRKKFTVVSELHRVVGEDKEGNRTYVSCDRFEEKGGKYNVTTAKPKTEKKAEKPAKKPAKKVEEPKKSKKSKKKDKKRKSKK